MSHLALARLAASGKIHTLVTQNIDGLHQAAGTDPDLIVEIHGTMHQVMCMSCERRSPMPETLDRVRAGEEDPPCRACGGILKSATISFGQNLVVEDLERATRAASQCDLLLAIGSSLGVFPAAGLVPIAREHGAALVIVNGEETGFDPMADAVVRPRSGRRFPPWWADQGGPPGVAPRHRAGYLSSLIFRRGRRANHQTLAMVARTPTAAAGLTSCANDLTYLGRYLPRRQPDAAPQWPDSSPTHMPSILFP